MEWLYNMKAVITIFSTVLYKTSILPRTGAERCINRASITKI